MSERDLRELRSAAAEFYRVSGVPQEIERALNEVFVLQPGDVYGHLVDFFAKLSAPARISRLKGSHVYDARGQPSVQTEVCCLVRNKEKSMSSASVSSCWTPERTSLDWRAGSEERAQHVTTAVQWINEPLSDMLKDRDPCDQADVDRVLRNYLTTQILAEKEKQKNQETHPSSRPEVAPPSPPPTQNKGKKSAEKGKKRNSSDKPFPPAEPPEPVAYGSMAIGSVSLAVAKTGAQVQGVPLYKYIAAQKHQKVPEQFHIPVAMVTLLCCGKTSPGKLSLLEEVILVPRVGQTVKQTVTMTLELLKEMMRITKSSTKAGATQAVVCDGGALAVSFERPEQPLDLVSEACGNLGLALGTELHLVLNCAAPELVDYAKGKYEVAAGALKSPDELLDTYQTLSSKYPAVVAFIDPFRREDTDQWEKLSHAIGDSCSLLSDITYRPQAPPLPGVRGHILKHTTETTVSDMICITSEHQGTVMMGITSDEPCSDSSFSDIVVGLSLDYVKLGGLSGAERMTKYNRLIAIEEELAQQGILVYKEKHSRPLFPEEPAEPTATVERTEETKLAD